MANSYQQRAYQQTVDWVNGKPLHNNVDNECCPDFSCCVPSLFETRRSIRIIQANRFAKEHGFPLLPEVKPPIKGIDLE